MIESRTKQKISILNLHLILLSKNTYKTLPYDCSKTPPLFYALTISPIIDYWMKSSFSKHQNPVKRVNGWHPLV